MTGKIETKLIRRIRNHFGSSYWIFHDENGLLLDIIHIYKRGKHWWNKNQYVATLNIEGMCCGTNDASVAKELVKFGFRVMEW